VSKTDVKKIVINSKKAVPGSVFLPIAGEKFDGHTFIDEAVANGAKVVYVSKDLGKYQQKFPDVEFILVEDTTRQLGIIASEHLRALRATCKVIAITGSVGKTTTKDITAQMLAKFGRVVYAKESYNNEIGLPLTILASDETTDFLVLEMGANHVGEIKQLTEIADPDVAVVLKTGVAHVGEFAGRDNIFHEKTQIFSLMGANRQLGSGVAIVNADDDYYDQILGRLPSGAEVLTFGIQDVVNLSLDDHLHVSVDVGAVHISTQISGAHNVYNILAAVRIGEALGFGLPEIAQALAEVAPIAEHRMQVQNLGDVVIIDDTYNANPDSMRAGLDALQEIATSRGARKIAILGDMLELGDLTARAHAEIGQYAIQKIGVEHLLVIGENTDHYGEFLTDEERQKVVPFNETSKKSLLSTCKKLKNVVLLFKGSSAMRLWETVSQVGEYIKGECRI
jgi:UDP-N-acetylmuramoyl-tripeptide--D-alanyl-D-alanine ligase